MTDYELMELAVQAREKSYAPYSDFHVGAALLGKSGKVYLGCNVENAGYSPTNCAERTALFKAVSEGEQSFTAIAVVGGKGKELAEFCAPCGVCRQALAEFCDGEFRVILGTPKDIRAYSFKEFLPFAFGRADLT